MQRGGEDDGRQRQRRHAPSVTCVCVAKCTRSCIPSLAADFSSSVVVRKAGEVDQQGRGQGGNRCQSVPKEHQVDHGVADDEARAFAAVDIAEVVVCPAGLQREDLLEKTQASNSSPCSATKALSARPRDVLQPGSASAGR